MNVNFKALLGSRSNDRESGLPIRVGRSSVQHVSLIMFVPPYQPQRLMNPAVGQKSRSSSVLPLLGGLSATG